MPIRILSPEVASQIAAGEVVERPASVVKELIENSLDAGARTISITIKGAGRNLIEVGDDGGGIPIEELPLVIERHATSKLETAADLFQINTLGFRGEALASIGSISRLTIITRTSDSDTGARLRIEGGKMEPLNPTSAPVGTQVQVENLFFNVPARLKFLKTDRTERRLIDKLVTRYALAYPQIRFHLKQDDRSTLQTSGNNDRREVLASLYGADSARQMLEVLSKGETINMQGFTSPTDLTRSHRREIFFFVNGRPVQDAALSAALIKAYHTLLMVGRYPLAAILVEMPPETIDVNVHPTKAEVRFRQPDQVFSEVRNGVRRALLAHSPVPGIHSGEITWSPASRQTELSWRSLDNSHRVEVDQWGPPAGLETTKTGQTETSTQSEFRNQGVPLLRLIGQVANAYLVAEGPDGLYLVDQHAAHERILFERFMEQKRQRIPSQSLLQPVTVELSPDSAELLGEQLPVLADLGFEVEDFGVNTFLVRAIPELLGDSDPSAAVRVLVEDFEEDETPLQSELEARIIARVCKRAAVKAGKTLSQEEQRALLLDLEACQSPRTCPHGRPTMIHLSVDLLERQFGRRGAR